MANDGIQNARAFDVLLSLVHELRKFRYRDTVTLEVSTGQG